MTPDPLHRFLEPHERDYERALAEIRRGRKTSHWMWYIFPQIQGLGASETSRYYAIASLEEAKAYLAHPMLGARLLECTALVNQIANRSLVEIFGTIDAMKFRSSMTLFREANARTAAFRDALDKYCDGKPDELTLAFLRKA